MSELNKLDQDRRVSVLIIDDEAMSRKTAKMLCEELISRIEETDCPGSLNIMTAATIEEAVMILQNHPVQIIFLDKDLGLRSDGTQINGVDHIRELLSIQPFAKILINTADLSYREIARAMREGATDYLMKSSAPDFSEYRETVVKLALKLSRDDLRRARFENRKAGGPYANFVCSSPSMQRFEEKLKAIAESSRPVVLLGATGLGKGASARRLNEFRANHLGQRERLLFKKISAASRTHSFNPSYLALSPEPSRTPPKIPNLD